jgi:glycosyltransferase involved in cell wall biosynthesis
VADDLESLWVLGHRSFPPEEFTIDGLIVHRFSICYKRWPRRATRIAGLLPYWRLKAQFWTPGFRVPGFDKALREIDGSVFHVGPLPYNNLMYAGLRAAELRRVSVVATPCLHLGEPESNAVLRHYLQAHQIELLRRCDRVLCMTDLEREFLQSAGVPSARLLTIGYGIDVHQVTGGDGEAFRRRHNIDGSVVLHLGVKAYEKGSMTLLEAMKLLWQQGSKAWLVMAGPSMAAFDAYISSQPEPLPRFLNLPAFADEEKRDLMAVATVVAQPSRVESLGLVLLEAWANGKPVIAADIAVSRELVKNSGGGVVTRFGHSAGLAALIKRLLDAPELCRTMGLRGQQAARAFDGEALWVRNAEALENVALH